VFYGLDENLSKSIVLLLSKCAFAFASTVFVSCSFCIEDCFRVSYQHSCQINCLCNQRMLTRQDTSKSPLKRSEEMKKTTGANTYRESFRHSWNISRPQTAENNEHDVPQQITKRKKNFVTNTKHQSLPSNIPTNAIITNPHLPTQIPSPTQPRLWSMCLGFVLNHVGSCCRWTHSALVVLM